ncbi:tagatose-6-phosphate kinase [Enterococcus florum]|uniref:Tagatose-6-phosphate kinase n=1 Tax=Enterococcus florum TaxID=2480627 RepID=A0A4P5P9A7_9ENTE|nr:PfkB family carbohydrate kinase [Enterococcus florum]GCF92548.1 tagatose-6-phosphate kinase [Enterococcus florum]
MIHLICPNPAIDRTLLIDGFVKEKPNRPYELKEFAGGKGFNVAYAIGFESPDVDFCVHTIAGGRNGELLIELANANKTKVELTRIDKNTRVCNIIMDTHLGDTYPIYENSFDLNPMLLEEFTENLKKKIHKKDVVVFSGSLMKGMPAEYIADFIKGFRDEDVNVFVDTSSQALVHAYEAKPYAIKINDEEILDLFPDLTLDTIESYVELLKSERTTDIPVFIITLGAKGIIAKMEDQIFHIQAKQVQAKNPIACGDFFLGGLVKYNCLQSDALTTLKKAISYSTANVLSWYPELNQKDIDAIYHSLEVQKYK